VIDRCERFERMTADGSVAIDTTLVARAVV
jgi:hypothetical protein